MLGANQRAVTSALGSALTEGDTGVHADQELFPGDVAVSTVPSAPLTNSSSSSGLWDDQIAVTGAPEATFGLPPTGVHSCQV
jgi:hypothetical protein